MTRLHIPTIIITTPTPTEEHPFVPGHLTHLTVDGQEWQVIDYTIEGDAGGPQTVALTFYADVIIRHPEGER